MKPLYLGFPRRRFSAMMVLMSPRLFSLRFPTEIDGIAPAEFCKLFEMLTVTKVGSN